MIMKSLLGVFLVILFVTVTEQDRGVDGHKTLDDHDYGDLAEYDEDHHRKVIDESDDIELSGGRTRGHEDDDDDEYTRDHHYGHGTNDGVDQDRRGQSSSGGNAGSRSRGNQEHSYDPYSGQRAPSFSESDEYEHSGDYNSQSQQYSSSPSSHLVDQYLHLIQLQGVPSDLAQYAETYLQHAKNTISTYGYQAKDFEKIRPCLESVVKYFNLLNIDLANEYNRCKRKCFLDRLNSYTTAISQYTVTTSACINSRMH
uniref:27 kDa salivary protein B n=1 Tax=Phlebotomus arabicus TaxID=578135 RepID=C6G4E5_9DIPT